MSPQVAYFFKKIYGNIIKWWFVIYNPIVRRIWPTKQEEEVALEKEKEEEEAQLEESRDIAETLAQEEPVPAYEEEVLEDAYPEEAYVEEPAPQSHVIIDDDNYNETTGAFSGLYGKTPLDQDDQNMVEEIMKRNHEAHSIDSLIPSPVEKEPTPEVTAPSDQDAVLQEANAIYERLLQEAAADEAAKQAEIEAAKAAQS